MAQVRTHVMLLALAAGAQLGCSSLPPVGDPSNRLRLQPPAPDEINWPEQYKPEDAGFFVQNKVEIRASPEAVWSILIQAETWPAWYEGAEAVKVLNPRGGVLQPGSVFSWSTMGLDFNSKVTEFAPPHRLSWESRKASIKGYHAWLIVPTQNGCLLITEESQHGFLTYMQKVFVPDKLYRLHDVWLREIKKKAET